jgi:predicted transcriptional regulator
MKLDVGLCQHAVMSRRLRVLIPSELNARLNQAAERSYVSKSEWVRRALEKALREGPSSDPVSLLAKLNAPTADIDQMLAEIGAGRC